MVFFSPSFSLLENILFSFFLLYFSNFPSFFSFFFFFHYYFILVFNSVASLGAGQSAGDLARWSLVWPVPPFFCWGFCCFTILPSFSSDLFSLYRQGLFHSIIPVKFLCCLFLVWLGFSYFYSFVFLYSSSGLREYCSTKRPSFPAVSLLIVDSLSSHLALVGVWYTEHALPLAFLVEHIYGRDA